MYDVIVIGAGLSGLYSGYLLAKAGVNFCILEATHRPGGRVHSQSGSGYVVDLGAQWIGPGQRRMYALAKEFGLETAATYHKGKHVLQTEETLKFFKGALPPLGLAANLDLIQISLRIAWLCRKKARAADNLKHTSADDWIKKLSYTKAGYDFWSFIVSTGTCAEPGAFSAAELIEQIKSIGGLGKLESAETDYFPGGAQSIALRLAEKLSAQIRFKSPVDSIQATKRGDLVTVHAGQESIQCKRVLVAVPPQLYPGLNMHLPKMELQTSQVVNCAVVKNILTYPSPWWRSKGFSGLSYSFKSPLGVTMDTSPTKDGPGVLVLLSGGPKAGVVARLDEGARRKFCEDHVMALFGPGPNSTGFYTKNWAEQPWSLGGYASRPKLGAAQLPKQVGPIYFAGTEVASEWRSYMEGALAAGEQAVTSLLKNP